IVAGRTTDLREGAAQAAESIASGRAQHALDRLVEITHREIVTEE
ncbi:MAG: hypothetical protein RLY86_2923, partial [Pseudomonadota bacterium]